MAKRRRSSGVISRPVAAQRLEVAAEAPRKFLDVRNRYDGAEMGRRLGSWNPPASGPNRAISKLQILRNRSRDAVRNEWQAAGALRVKVTNIIGTGITPRPTTTDETLKKKLTDLWNEFVPLADADGLLDYYGMQALAARCRAEAGEVFLRARPRRLESGYGVPFQIQMLEPEMCPLLDADTWPGMPQFNRMRQGIEFNRMGQRIAYWFYKDHPGDFFSGRVGQQDLIRVSAEFVKHLFKPLRIGQIRGIPDATTNLAPLRVVTDFNDAVLARQHTANLFTGFVKKNGPTGSDIDPITGKAIEYDDNGTPLASMEPGTMQELLPGEDVVFADPPDAGTNYADFMRWQTLGLSAGEGVPYELLTGDLRDVSDRVLRVMLNEFHRQCEQEQWHTIIPGVCAWVRQQWVKYYVLAGKLNTGEAEDAAKVTWSPDAWKYTHPVQDIQALQLEVENGFRSRASVIAERGDDPQEVDSERKVDQEREIALGLSFEPVDPNAQQPVDPQTQAATEKANAEKDKVKAEETLILAKARSELSVGDAEARRLSAVAAREEAEAKLLGVKSDLTVAEQIAVEAKAEYDRADADYRVKALAAAEARANAESEARIAALEETANLAREDARRKADAQAASDAFVAEQRDLVLKAERTRAEVAALEKEAAQIGLAELRQ